MKAVQQLRPNLSYERFLNVVWTPFKCQKGSSARLENIDLGGNNLHWTVEMGFMR